MLISLDKETEGDLCNNAAADLKIPVCRFGFPETSLRGQHSEFFGKSPALLDVKMIHSDFPIFSRQVNGKPLVYLDNGASAQKPQGVIDAMSHAYGGCDVQVI